MSQPFIVKPGNSIQSKRGGKRLQSLNAPQNIRGLTEKKVKRKNP